MAAHWDATQASPMADPLTLPPKTIHDRRITLRLSSRTAEALHQAAADRDCRPAELARRALEVALDQAAAA